MIGIILSYDTQRRCGYIGDEEKKESYYFGRNSVADAHLLLKVGNHVKFDLLKVDDRKPVAIHIFAYKPQLQNIMPTKEDECSSDHVDAVVVWFDIQKRYGFVSCPTTSAFLHISELRKVGLSYVKPGQHIKVRLMKSKYHGRPTAVDVIVTEQINQFEKSKVPTSHCSTVPGTSSGIESSGSHNLKASPAAQQHDETSTMQKNSHPLPSKSISTEQFSNPKCAIINKQIQQKTRLLQTLNIHKLPDGGRRLQEQIKDLQAKLDIMCLSDIKNDSSKAEEKLSGDSICNVQNNTNDKEKHCDTFKYNQTRDIFYKNLNEGDRMTTKRIDMFQKVTSEAIEKLHTVLETCPSPDTELTDPDGLLVNLMTHQRQALAWLAWREKQSVSGGILADDMGLGKTLTMIALLLKQTQISNAEDAVKDTEDHVVVKTEKNDEDDGGLKLTSEETEDDSNTDDFIQSESTLIVAPASLIYHWKAEIRNRCKKGLLSIHLYHGSAREKNGERLAEFDVVITTYDLVRRCMPKEKPVAGSTEEKPDKEQALFSIKWRRIILDEAHQIRNYKSQTSIAACLLNAESRWALSGTPVQNQETDMYAMIKFLRCRPYDEYKLWKNQVSNKTEQGQRRLKTLVSSLVLRREKSQKNANGKPLIHLPERHFKTHSLKLNEMEQEVYDKLKIESRTKFSNYEKSKHQITTEQEAKSSSGATGQKLSATHLLVMLLRLRQCCGHLALLQNKFDLELLEKEKREIAVEDLFQYMSLESIASSPNKFLFQEKYSKDKAIYFEPSSSSSKIKFVMDTLHKLKFEQPDDKCVIISQWTSMLKILAIHLDKAKMSYGIIDGSVSAKKRMEVVDEFNRNPIKPKIMLVSIQAGGVGLNLVGGNHLFLLDMHWNPALEKQAFDRIYRVGQSKEVFVHKFVVDGTVEEQILKLQKSKLTMAKAVMDGAATESKVKLTLADMKILFGI